MSERDLTPGPDDAKIAAIYRGASGEEPPAALDSAVLRNARSAVAPRAAEPRTSWWMPWRVPFAFAAVAVLSVSIVLVADREGDALKLEREAPSTVAPAGAPPPTAAVKPPEAFPAAPESKTSAAKAPEPPARFEPPPAASADVGPAKLAENQVAASGRAREAAAAKAETEARRDDRESSDRLQALAKRRTEDTARVMHDEAAPQPPVTMTAPPPPPAAAGQAAPPAAMSAPAVALERAPSAAGAAASAPAPAPAMRPYAAQEAKPLVQQRRAAPADAAAMTPAVAALVAELDKRPAADWLARIAALRREGRVADADGLLAEFRRRFPDEPVPPSDR